MGLLDDAIREHLELKRKHGADPDDVARQEQEALGQGGPRAEFAQPATTERPPAEPEPEGEPGIAEEPSEGHPAAAPTASPGGSSPAAPVHTPGGSPRDEDPWLDEEPDEVPADEALERRRAEPGGDDDVLDQTPEFLQETPEHDRLWFEQKPPREFDWDK